jgi:hypothetical protein
LCSEHESVKIFGKNPRWRIFEQAVRTTFCPHFLKKAIFSKKLRFVEAQNTKKNHGRTFLINIKMAA